ncbi:MAG: phosphoheptose isomerase [Deltaproteobacteria bacterium RBG_13_65_10]|nr:MAG: phosphoheptose isomerase [Deltaproteobacteria bacterium RBG_13_65_10]
MLRRFAESARVKVDFAERSAEAILAAAEMIVEAFKAGHKVLLFGNGGSAADAQHMAAEFVNRFQIERPALPAIALTTDTSALTSIGNDYDFREIFARQLKALAREGDVAIAISTSGTSANVLRAVQAAREIPIHVIAFTGRGGGEMAKLSDIALVVPSDCTQHIQESHITVGHVICELVDQILFHPAAP